MSAIDLISIERERQIKSEGWTPEHDDEHDEGELALAAACYATPDLIYVKEEGANGISFDDPWPWSDGDRRPHKGNVVCPNHVLGYEQRIHQLVKAGALIVAEIERLQRKESSK